MVIRKASLPYPASPAKDNAEHQPYITSKDDLIIDSSDLPPIPRLAQSTRSAHGLPFANNDNPWSDTPSQFEMRSDRPMPNILKPGRPTEAGRQTSFQDIPHILRVGTSGEDTPRSSSESERNFWDDDEANEEDGSRSPKKVDDSSREQPAPQAAPVRAPPSPLGISNIKRKPIAVASPIVAQQTASSPGPHFASNNPFRHPPSSESLDHQQYPLHVANDPDRPGWGEDDSQDTWKGKEVEYDHSTSSTSYNDLLRLHLGNSALSSSQSIDTGHPQHEAHLVPPHPQAPPPPVPPQPAGKPPPIPHQQHSPLSEQPPLIAVTPKAEQDGNPWQSNPSLAPTPSPIPFDQSQKQVSEYKDDLLDRGQQTGVVSLGEELNTLPNSARPNVDPHQQSSLLDDDGDIGPPLPTRPSPGHPTYQDTVTYSPPEGPPPSKPPRPSIITTRPSEAEVARMTEQRNETYQIKHFNWFDHGSGRLRRSSMLTQNKNGPCPLLALVNALILGAKDETQAALDDALRSREQVTLGLIIETLMDELLSRGQASGAALPDVDELNGFLMRLRTGMNANPRFIPHTVPPPNLMDARNSMLHLPQSQRAQNAGTFESTPDMKLYGAFSIPLLHGWLPEADSDAAAAFSRSAQTYEDAMAVQFGEEELEYKLSRGGLSGPEQQMWEDIVSIKTFLKQYPTQLTPHGLESVQSALSSGSFAIMFRNDHFSTIYKHPDSGQLFTLITDAGYADRDEIIWESLVDISGAQSEFFSGDFMPVSHDASNASGGDRASSNRRRSSNQQSPGVDTTAMTPLSPQEQQEQHDADFAMALQMQEEEEQRQRAEQARRRSGGGPGANPGNLSRGNSGIPIPLRSAAAAPVESRPLIPPRNSRSQNPGVNRPTDENEEDTPPSYEEAARVKPYVPPVGSPLHPTASPGSTPGGSTSQLVGTVSNTSNSGSAPQGQGQGPSGSGGAGGGRRLQPQRRMSAYSETNSQHNLLGPGGGGTMGMHGRRTSYGQPGLSRGPTRLQQLQQLQQQQQAQGQQGVPQGQERDCVVM